MNGSCFIHSIFKTVMKKIFLPLIILGLFAVSCKKVDKNPQPATFSVASADMADLKPGTTLQLFSVVVPDPAIVAPIDGTGFSWDYSLLNSVGNVFNYYDTASNSSFPSATFSSFQNETFGAGTVVATSNTRYYTENNSTALATLGSRIDTVVLSYPAVGTITYPAQSVVNTDKMYSAKYPLNYGDSWSGSGIKTTYNFIVNAPLAGFNNTPGTQVITTDYACRVLASGYMKLKGYAYNTLPVLAVKQQTTTKVNYFVNGTPAPASLLSLAGITDGQVKTSISYIYYSPSIGYVGTLNMNSANTALQSAVLRKYF